MENLTQIQLASLYKYDKETGFFYSLKSHSRWKSGRKVGTICADGYVHMKVLGKMYRAHSLAWLYVYGKFPKISIDHINRIKHDNRIINLRDVDFSIQNINKEYKGNNKTGYKGVTLTKSGKYLSSCGNQRLGVFINPFDAHIAYVDYTAGIL